MEEEKKGKEYYQVNLDTGRIFWIVFVVGLVLIGIFIFGFWIGGDKDKKEIFKIGKLSIHKKEEALKIENKGEPSFDILKDNIGEEAKYINIENIENAFNEEQQNKEAFSVLKIEKGYEQKKPVIKKACTYIKEGNYYIQIASFEKEENAKKYADELRKKMYKVIIKKAVVDGKTFYRVRVGPFETKGIATNTMISMKKKFNLIRPFVLETKS